MPLSSVVEGVCPLMGLGPMGLGTDGVIPLGYRLQLKFQGHTISKLISKLDEQLEVENMTLIGKS